MGLRLVLTRAPSKPTDGHRQEDPSERHSAVLIGDVDQTPEAEKIPKVPALNFARFSTVRVGQSLWMYSIRRAIPRMPQGYSKVNRLEDVARKMDKRCSTLFENAAIESGCLARPAQRSALAMGG
jgi:hypothetical protein